MKRGNFIKSLLGLAVAPRLLSSLVLDEPVHEIEPQGLKCEMTGGKIKSITITSGGSGYTVEPKDIVSMYQRQDEIFKKSNRNVGNYDNSRATIKG